MTDVPSFDEFFRALHPGRSPFPWQVRLAAEVLESSWPDLLDLPTGVGKTTALDIALYTLALDPAHMPRRTVLVVDRRIVVDQGASHAREILKEMRRATTGPLKVIADRLRALFGGCDEDAPFNVAVLRGGMPRDNDWARTPGQPVLGLSTVDQVGSRLLFRGYGVSPKSASVHAGLLGNDTLLLLDEVHLAEPFAQTVGAIRSRCRQSVEGMPHRFAVVRMSATPGKKEPDWRVFSLVNADQDDATLARRLTTSKPARLRRVEAKGDEDAKRKTFAEAAAKEAIELQKAGLSVIGIVVNRVATAHAVRQNLEAHQAQTDAVLVTGRMRPVDRDQVVRTQLLPRSGTRDSRESHARPIIVVATQCIEAGADLDFDGLVTECASLDALRQRFGRLDRQGNLGKARAIVLGRSDTVAAAASDPVYGDALRKTWEWLEATATDGVVDFGVRALTMPVNDDGTPCLELLSPSLAAPVLLPAHLDAWVQTSPVADFAPDIEPWLHGPRKEAADVQIVWRRGLRLPSDPSEEADLRTIARAELSLVRPTSLEAMSVPIAAARRWLSTGKGSEIADTVAGDADEDSEERERRGAKSNEQRIVAIRWDGDETDWVRANSIRPGAILVVPAEIGGVVHGSFEPTSKSSVTDLSLIAAVRAHASWRMFLEPDCLNSLEIPEPNLQTVPVPEEEEGLVEYRERLAAWTQSLPHSLSDGSPLKADEWNACLEALRKGARLRVTRPRLTRSGSQIRGAISVSVRLKDPQREISSALSESDQASFTEIEISLAGHCDHVRTVALDFAKRVGFSQALSDDIALAAWYHDVGKADPRFQRWLCGGSEVKASLLRQPIAKSPLPSTSFVEMDAARERAGYPSGYRHELLSCKMLQNCEDALRSAHDADLVLHLIASHHGWGRPFAPFADHPENHEVTVRHGESELRATTRHVASRLDSGIADRFWRLIDKYGWWGLAWLEATLRLADHRASEQEAERRS